MKERRKKREKIGIKSNCVNEGLNYLQIKEKMIAFWSKLFGNWNGLIFFCILRGLLFSLFFKTVTWRQIKII